MKNLKNKIDFVVIVFSAFVLMGVVGFVQPRVIGPINGYATSETEVLFSIENAEIILIDDNMDFTSPDEYEVVDGLKLNLAPGQYYWKAVGISGSKINSLTIESEVSLELVENNGNFSVVNSGNTKLLVDVYNGTELVEKKKLSVGESVELIATKFEGEMYE